MNKTICWGLTTNRKSLIMTDGTNKISFIHPITYAITKQITVKYDNLNAVCYKNKHIYANIWIQNENMKNKIIKICAKTGTVVKEFDFSNLIEKENN